MMPSSSFSRRLREGYNIAYSQRLDLNHIFNITSAHLMIAIKVIIFRTLTKIYGGLTTCHPLNVQVLI